MNLQKIFGLEEATLSGWNDERMAKAPSDEKDKKYIKYALESIQRLFEYVSAARDYLGEAEIAFSKVHNKDINSHYYEKLNMIDENLFKIENDINEIENDINTLIPEDQSINEVWLDDYDMEDDSMSHLEPKTLSSIQGKSRKGELSRLAVEEPRILVRSIMDLARKTGMNPQEYLDNLGFPENHPVRKMLGKGGMWDPATLDETYFSSEDAMNADDITRKQAIRELAKHGVTGQELELFFQEVGDKPLYTGEEILGWLGY